MVYKIMVIDDEYGDVRKRMYETFLSVCFPEVEITFEIEAIEYARDISNINQEKGRQIDAFFIDARLDSADKGWGATGFDMDFNGVLSKIESAYEGEEVPPIFMISKHWTDEDLLSMVSKSFSVFHQSVQPARFFSLANIENCIKSAIEKDAHGKLNYRSIADEREYIYKEIRKVKQKMYITGAPIDVVLILAVPDEKDAAYKVFGISSDSIEFNPIYNLYYNVATIGKFNIAILAQPDMGMVNASILATSSILAFKPKIIAMTGICAGRKSKTTLCDIIIPSETFDYTRGKKNWDGTEYRPAHQPLNTIINGFINNKVDQKLLTVIRTNYYGQYPEKDMKLHTKPMATGTWVVNDPNIFEEISEHVQGDCIALDMEAYAIAVAAQTLNTKWIVIKSVQDYADGEKNTDEKLFRHFAAYSSAKLLFDILPNLMRAIE